MSLPKPETEERVNRADLPKKIIRIAIVIFLISLSVAIFVNRDRITPERFRALGYQGVFLMALIGSSTVVFPIPHLAFTFTMGAVLNPWIVGLSAGFGDAMGEITGYMAGYAVEDAVDQSRLYRVLERWMRRNGDLTIFVLSLLPVPFFDLAAMAGGVVGYPFWRFMIVTWAGKTIKAIVAAWAGSVGVAWLAQLLGVR
jgi:uncharacterized membrane protein YdjX (TVP38/TMEM64 family)